MWVTMIRPLLCWSRPFHSNGQKPSTIHLHPIALLRGSLSALSLPLPTSRNAISLGARRSHPLRYNIPATVEIKLMLLTPTTIYTRTSTGYIRRYYCRPVYWKAKTMIIHHSSSEAELTHLSFSTNCTAIPDKSPFHVTTLPPYRHSSGSSRILTLIDKAYIAAVVSPILPPVPLTTLTDNIQTKPWVI